MPKIPRPWFKFNGEVVRDLIARRHLTVTSFAFKVGVSRSTMSNLLNEKNLLSAGMRRQILDSGVFDAVPEDVLWREI